MVLGGLIFSQSSWSVLTAVPTGRQANSPECFYREERYALYRRACGRQAKDAKLYAKNAMHFTAKDAEVTQRAQSTFNAEDAKMYAKDAMHFTAKSAKCIYRIGRSVFMISFLA